MDSKQREEAANVASRSIAFAREQGVLLPGTMRLAPQYAEAATKVTENVLSLSETLKRLVEVWSKIDWKPVFKLFGAIAEQGRKAELVENSGWLPHHTTPFALLECAEGDRLELDHVDAIISAYYRANWNEVEARFRAQIETYEIDAEAKATFIEALAIHGAGHYRAAPRLLFPEIERVASNAFFGGKRRILVETENGKTQSILITRLKEVRKSARTLPAGDIFGFEFGWQLFTKLEQHLYEEVGDDPAVRETFAADPVPNRHGALHGIITYKDTKTSLNAIIMTDFMFHLIGRLKLRLGDTDALTGTHAGGVDQRSLSVGDAAA